MERHDFMGKCCPTESPSIRYDLHTESLMSFHEVAHDRALGPRDTWAAEQQTLSELAGKETC